MTSEDKIEIRQMMVEVVGGAFEDIVLPKFEKIDGRFDDLENRIERVENRIERVETDIKYIKIDVRATKEKVETIDFRLKNIEENYRADSDAIYDHLDKHDNMFVTVRSQIKGLETKLL